MAFEKGKSGNPAGTRKERLWREAIIAAAKEHTGEQDLKMALKKLAIGLVRKSEEGDVVALKEIGVRVDGQPDAHVNVEHSGNVTHEHKPISETADFIAGALGLGAVGAPEKPVLN